MIVVSEQICLDSYRDGDQDQIALHLNNRKIYDQTLAIPFPYTRDHANEWIETVNKSQVETQFAIRDGDQNLIGGCGLIDLVSGHRTDIGYWLGEPFWGRGIMSQVVPKLCEFSARRWNLTRIGAEVFDGNSSSVRVLEKSGFEFEGMLRRYHRKEGQFIDIRIYSILF